MIEIVEAATRKGASVTRGDASAIADDLGAVEYLVQVRLVEDLLAWIERHEQKEYCPRPEHQPIAA